MNSTGASGVTVPPADKPGAGVLPRLASVAVLLPVTLFCLYAGGWLFAALVALAGVLMALEWDRLVGGPARPGLVAVVMALALLLAVLTTARSGPGLGVIVLAVGLVALLAAALVERRPVSWALLGGLWLGLPTLGVVWLRGTPELGFAGTLWLLAAIWASDTGAYAAGRGIGGPKLAPRISPKKTWAGLAGGMAAAALVSLALAGFGYAGPAWLLAVLGAGLAVVSQVGDLAESAVKRHFGVKDSGTLIPGHGGILDRVDALLFAVLAALALAALTDGPWFRWQ
ncbi:MAG TPA: phosphatidate cytidylyltransferase [Alphaproteobacteria bacterium]|nr:phosphatidate cytidylyltransferase [Alphaproteobacteria bacterium]